MAKNETPLEAFEQELIFKWIRSNQIREPKLQLAYGTLNGIKLSKMLAVKAKKQGNRVGVPDIVLPAKSFDGKYPGLYIELKRLKGGKVSAEQKRYHKLLMAQGYMVMVEKGHQDAIRTISIYLGFK